jgi:hypothetical protein
MGFDNSTVNIINSLQTCESWPAFAGRVSRTSCARPSILTKVDLITIPVSHFTKRACVTRLTAAVEQTGFSVTGCVVLAWIVLTPISFLLAVFT